MYSGLDFAILMQTEARILVQLSFCMFLLAVVELFNNYCPFLVILGVMKLTIQDFVKTQM